jgi:acetoacetyl-CoA reductase
LEELYLLSSINGLKGQVGQTNYSAAKAGIIGFSKALALENANKGITVNVIAPGYVGTDMVKKIDPTIFKGIRMSNSSWTDLAEPSMKLPPWQVI